VPALTGLSEARRCLGEAGNAQAQARLALEHPRALAHERTLARIALARALADGGDAGGAAAEGRRALDEAEAMGLKVAVAQASVLLDQLPPAVRPADSDQLAQRGREALQQFLAQVPVERVAPVRARADLKDVLSGLEPAADAAGKGG